MEFRESKRLEVVVLVLSILLLCPLFVEGMYNRPTSDDFAYSAQTRQVVKEGGNAFQVAKAAWDTDVRFYNMWQGLYSSAFLQALHPGIWGERNYAWTTVIVIALALACLAGSLYILNKYLFKRSPLFVASASLAVLAMLMLDLPSAFSGLYWYNGAINYMPWIFADLLNACLVVDAFQKRKQGKRWMAPLLSSVLLSFLISGGNHVTAFCNILVLLVEAAALGCFRCFYAIAPLCSACAGFVVMYVAPGTSIRQDALSEQGVGDTILASLWHVRDWGGDWFNAKLFLSLVLITPLAIQTARENRRLFSMRNLVVSLVCSFAIICGMFCVPYKAMGTFGAGRLTNVVWIAFMFLCWLNYFLAWGVLVKSHSKEPLGPPKKARKSQEQARCAVAAFCLLSIFILKNGGADSNSALAIKELAQGIPQEHAREMDERFALCNDDSLHELEFEPISVKSKLLFEFGELGPDPYQYPNNHMGNYYNKIISLKTSST